MPDETLHSRITRYHLLSGNKTENDTFKDLFGTTPFAFKIIPKKTENLANLLPGDREENLNELLTNNTILPLYKPFVGISKVAVGGFSDSLASTVARVPRREVSVHSMAKICLSCTQSDLIENGYSYWHRAHHIPGVTACWRHSEELIQACPSCSHPFYRSNKLLPSLTSGCVCGWRPLSSSTGDIVTEVEHKFAIFAKDLLHRDLPAVDCEILSACYRRQARKLGFLHGQFMATNKLFESIQSEFGTDLLSKMDKAFAAGKRFQWIRTTANNGQMDMPITRHLIISYHLFRDVDNFEKSLAHESLLFKTTENAPPQKPSVRRQLQRCAIA